jgi:hypothetical protein
MFAPEVSGDDVIDRQPAFVFPAILAGIIIAPKHFAACQFDTRPRSVHLIL